MVAFGTLSLATGESSRPPENPPRTPGGGGGGGVGGPGGGGGPGPRPRGKPPPPPPREGGHPPAHVGAVPPPPVRLLHVGIGSNRRLEPVEGQLVTGDG